MSKLNFIPFDTETDGLLDTVTKMYNLGMMWGGEVRVTHNIEDMKKMFNVKDTYFVCHNVLDFDVAVFKKLYNYTPPVDKLICTYHLSMALFPKRARHGLESWGEQLGISKPEVEDWVNEPIEVYDHRVTEDVKIQSALWNYMWDFLMRLYDGDETLIMKYISYIMSKAKQLEDQKIYRVPLDVEIAQRNLDKFTKLRDEKYEELIKVAPKNKKTSKRSKPKVMTKQDGSPSALGIKWSLALLHNGLPEDTEEFEEVVGEEDFNPNSTKQVKEWLYSLGWNPCTYEDRKVKDGINKVPQITNDKGELTPSVRLLLKQEPSLELFEGVGIIKHKIGLLKGFLECEEDGYLISSASKYTKTLRLAHKKPIANLPKVASKDRGGIKDGAYIRGCIKAKAGDLVCGADMSSLEDRMKQHFIYEYDREYVEDMMVDDFDPHIDLAVSSGRLTEEQGQAHKDGVENHKEVRDIFKTGNYACQFGAGAKKLSLSIGCTLGEAKQVHKAYWKRNWAVKEAAKYATIKTIEGKMYLLNPINNYYYFLSNKKDIFSSWCQGGGSYAVDVWIYFMKSMGIHPSLSYHDEVLITMSEGDRDEIEEKLKKAIAKTNKALSLNRDLGIDIQFGEDYGSVH